MGLLLFKIFLILQMKDIIFKQMIMKKCIFMLIVVAMVQVSMAQTAFMPTVVEGRVWNVVSICPSEPPLSDTTPGYYKDIKGRWGIGIPHTYVLKGDTVLGRVSYKKLFLDGIFISGLREENGRIYECYWDGVPEQPIFNYSLQTGDVFNDFVDDNTKMQVKLVREVVINGKSHRCLDMWAYDEGHEVIDGLVDYWIEGIGCMGGPHFPFWWSASQLLLLSCYDGEECLFSYEDIHKMQTANIIAELKTNENNGDSLFYDLQGRRMTTPQRNGLYIKNGKKFVVH